MASKLPLVIGADGNPQQLQAGDSINIPTSQTNVSSLENGNAGAITVGMVVYVSADDTVDKAASGASGTSKVFGLVYDASIASGASGHIATDGPVTATTAAWDALTGDTGGLVAGSDYFLGSTAGTLTATPPTAAGSYLVKVGTATSATVLEVDIGNRILL